MSLSLDLFIKFNELLDNQFNDLEMDNDFYEKDYEITLDNQHIIISVAMKRIKSFQVENEFFRNEVTAIIEPANPKIYNFLLDHFKGQAKPDPEKVGHFKTIFDLIAIQYRYPNKDNFRHIRDIRDIRDIRNISEKF